METLVFYLYLWDFKWVYNVLQNSVLSVFIAHVGIKN